MSGKTQKCVDGITTWTKSNKWLQDYTSFSCEYWVEWCRIITNGNIGEGIDDYIKIEQINCNQRERDIIDLQVGMNDMCII